METFEIAITDLETGTTERVGCIDVTDMTPEQFAELLYAKGLASDNSE
jgi:hypothetical protein